MRETSSTCARAGNSERCRRRRATQSTPSFGARPPQAHVRTLLTFERANARASPCLAVAVPSDHGARLERARGESPTRTRPHTRGTRGARGARARAAFASTAASPSHRLSVVVVRVARAADLFETRRREKFT